MAKRVLVIGGTRYFGKQLVTKLLEAGHRVTLLNRGKTKDSFGKRVERILADREDTLSLSQSLKNTSWDVVFDQVCYSPNDAQNIGEVLSDSVGRYVFTSTQSVYFSESPHREIDFDPFRHHIKMGVRADFNYPDGKRNAEAVFFQRKFFPITAVRIPIVLGPDDYTGRLEFHIDHVKSGKPMVVENLMAEISFIHSSEAADFIFWQGFQKIQGPINACSDGVISMQKVIQTVEEAVGKKALILNQGEEKDHTPFADAHSRTLDNGKAKEQGFKFLKLDKWFSPLVTELSKR